MLKLLITRGEIVILITGSAGFIGSVLLWEINKKGREDVILVDRLREGEKWLNLRGLKYREYVHADELFLEKNSELLKEVTVIYHMGACSSTAERNVDFLMENNVEYSKKLYKLAVELQVPFIYASSAATYGAGENGFNDDHSEIDKLRPLNPYGYSKQVFDQWVLSNPVKPALWFGLKFFNVFGPNEYHKERMRSVVKQAHEQISSAGEMKLFKSHKEGYADGEQLRDFVYAKDIAKVMVELANINDWKKSGIYNLGTGKARSFKDLAISTFKALGKEERINYIDMPEDLRNQYQYFTEANMDKLKSILPKFEFMSLEEAVTDYVINHLEKENQHLDLIGNNS